MYIGTVIVRTTVTIASGPRQGSGGGVTAKMRVRTKAIGHGCGKASGRGSNRGQGRVRARVRGGVTSYYFTLHVL